MLGLKEAKDLVETSRSTIKDDLTVAEAEQLARRFEGLAIVSVELSRSDKLIQALAIAGADADRAREALLSRVPAPGPREPGAAAE